MVTTDAQTSYRNYFAQARLTFRVIRRVTAAGIRAQAQYPANFILEFVFGILYQTSTLALAAVLITQFRGIGGFSTAGVVLIVGMRLVSHGLFELCFGNILLLPSQVEEGRFEGYFLRPMPILLQLLLSELRINALGDIAAGAVICGTALAQVHLHWTAFVVVFLIAAILGGLFVEASVQLVLASLTFRSQGVRAASTWVGELMATFGNYPLSIFPIVLRGIFTVILPVAFIAYLPVVALLDNAPPHSPTRVLAHISPVIGFGLFVFAYRFWNRSVRHYQSVGG
jgi:ABC-2 type transport system permease protein